MINLIVSLIFLKIDRHLVLEYSGNRRLLFNKVFKASNYGQNNWLINSELDIKRQEIQFRSNNLRFDEEIKEKIKSQVMVIHYHH